MSLCIYRAFPQSECVIGLEHGITDSGISLQDYTKRVKANLTGPKNSDFHKKIFPSYNKNFDNSCI